MASKGQKFNCYSAEVKLAVVKERLETGAPYFEIAEKYNIASQESVLKWCKSYQLYGEDAFVDKRGKADKSVSTLKGRPKRNFSSIDERNNYYSLIEQRNKELSELKKKRSRKKKLREARNQIKNQIKNSKTK